MQRVADAFKEAWLPLTLIVDRTEWNLWQWRWFEILSHYHYWNKTCKDGQHIRDYVVIDDDEFDMKTISQLRKFVKTKATVGITERNMNEIITYLNQ